MMKVLLCLSYFGWNAVPAVLMYVPYLLGMDIIANPTYIQCSYYNQIFLFFAYMLGFSWIKMGKTPKFLKLHDFQDKDSVFYVILYTSLVLTLYEIYGLMTSTGSYWDGNDISNLVAIGPIDFLAQMGVFFLIGAIFFARDRISPTLYKLSVALVILFFLVHTVRGGRIYIFGVVVFLIYYALSTRKKKMLIGSVSVGVMALLLLPILASLRGGERVKASDVLSSSNTATGTSIVAEILIKTNSVMYGSYLIEKDGIGKWDGQMYSSTLFALVPRFIYPSKPEPGSVDGTQYGLPARASAVYSVIGEYKDIENNGVPASLSSLWGGGWIAYIVEIISAAFLIFLINCIFYSGKPIFIGFIYSLISFPVGILEVPLPTVLIALQRDFVIYLIMVILFSSVKGSSKKRISHNYA